MRWTALERVAPLAGLVAVGFWILGVLAIEAFGDTPEDDAPAADLLRYYEDEQASIYAGSILFGVGCVFFLWFLGSLRSALRAPEGPGGVLSAVTFGAGVALITLVLASFAPDLSGAAAFDYLDRDLSPEAADALSVLGDGFLVMGFFMAFGFLGTAGIAIARSRVLPAWLGWVSLALGVLMLTPISWIFFFLGLPLWTLLVSALLYRRASAPAPAAG